MNKFLAFARTFNTLLPVLIVLLLVLLTGWGFVESSMRKTPGLSTVLGPGVEHEPSRTTYILKPANIPEQEGIAFFKLVSRKEKHTYAEGWSGEIRNLLVLKPGVEQATWLFPDQSLELKNIVELSGRGASFKALSIQALKPSTGNLGERVDLYLVSYDGSGLTRVLEGLDEVVGQTSYQDEVRVIYQKDDAVRSARISLSGRKVVSDTKIAGIEQIR